MPSNNSIVIVKNIIRQAQVQHLNFMTYIRGRAAAVQINEDVVDDVMNTLLLNDELTEVKDFRGVVFYFLRTKKSGPFNVHHTQDTSYDQEITPLVQVETDYLEYTVYETDQFTAKELWMRDCWDYQDKMSF